MVAVAARSELGEDHFAAECLTGRTVALHEVIAQHKIEFFKAHF